MTLFIYIGRTLAKNSQLANVCYPPFFWFHDNNRMHVNIKSIKDNKYMSDVTRTSLLDIYYKIKRVINGFERLVRIFRWRKARSASITTDLYMTPLTKFDDSQTLRILQNGTIYDFRITDLLTIWDNSLCHSHSLSPDPLFPKNPYTNVLFKTTHLVACYIKASSLCFDIPNSIVLFWNVCMNIDDFIVDAYPLLRERAVANYIYNSDTETLFYDIINMISSMKRYIGYKCIDEEMSIVDRDIFVSKLKRCLLSHLTSLHSCNRLKKYNHREYTISELRNIFKKSPGLGRRLVSRGIEFNRPRRSNATLFVFRGGL